MNPIHEITIVGGGLAGSEAAWQCAQRNMQVCLYEMRPSASTGAHRGSELAELVCSNSLGSSLPDHATGVLMNELRCLGSLLMECAGQVAIPAGSALAVDRDLFAKSVTKQINSHPNIQIVRKEATEIPAGITIIASGPLTSERLAQNIATLTGEDNLFFFDAIAPIVEADSINMDIAFRGSRYGKGEKKEGDYINCPLTRDEYTRFVEALLSAERIVLRPFEKDLEQGVKAGSHHFFEGCLPVEIIARRGFQALAFGPMRPIGLTNPYTGDHPFAVVQLRQDNFAGSLYNIVGFQTNLTYSEQRRVLRMIPGLEQAKFARYGQMHRNTFLDAPNLLLPTLQFRCRPELFFAGQLTGVEGYLGNIATGLLAGLNAVSLSRGETPLTPPRSTMLGALCYAITRKEVKDFQPMKANFGILPPLKTDRRIGRQEKAKLYSERASEDLKRYINDVVFL